MKVDKGMKLIRGLLNIPFESRKIAVEFLKSAIADGTKEKTFHNLLILFLSELGTDYELCSYLDEQEKVKKDKERV